MTKEKLCDILEGWIPSGELCYSLNTVKLLPILLEVILERSSKKDAEFRRNAYFVMGTLLRKYMDTEYCQFFVDCLAKETDKYVMDSMLTSIGWLDIPPEVNIEAMIACSKNDKWLIRRSAIYALRASDTETSREAVRYWVGQQDEKMYKFELVYANAVLGLIGDISDIDLLEQHTHSRIRDVKDTAIRAIDNIRQRFSLNALREI